MAETRRAPTVLSEADVLSYGEQGYYLGRGVLTEDECDEIIQRAEELHARKDVAGCFRAEDESDADGDPLRVYPRMMHPHRVDERCAHYLAHPAVVALLRDLVRDGVTALQSMFWRREEGGGPR